MININKKRPLYQYLIFTFVVLSLLLCSGCNSEKKKKYDIKGRVVTTDGVGLENVSILLYPHKPLAANVQNVKNLHPNHGAALSMYDTFDHRTETPISVAETNAEGLFSLKNVERGTYYLVAYKQNFGFQYIRELKIDKDQSNLQFELHPVIDLPTAILGSYDFHEGRTYRVLNDITLLPGSEVTVGSNVTIMFEPMTKMSVYGNVEISDHSFLLMMSADKVYSHSHDDTDITQYNSISFTNVPQSIIQNMKVIDSSLGISFSEMNNSTLRNCYINSGQAIRVAASPGFMVEQCTITNTTDVIRGGLYMEHSDEVVVERCHFFNNRVGGIILWSADVVVNNNYFHNNRNYDFGFDQNGAGQVRYNTFKESVLALHNYRGQMYAHHNDIDGESGIYATRVNAWLSAKHNNINCREFGIKSRCMYYNSDTVHLDCTQNYWYTTDTSEIRKLVYDSRNDSTSDPNYPLLVTIIDYTPFSSRSHVAGVYNE